jgi:flagellar protein FlgJ
MTVGAPSASLTATTATTATSNAGEARTVATVKHLAGLLWDEMLTALNQTGFSSNALGTGSDSYQSMFLWDISQGDMGKYDNTLVAAALRQFGAETDAGTGATATDALTSGQAAPEAVTPTTTLATIEAAGGSITATPLAAPDASVAGTQNGSLLTQAKNFARSIWPMIVSAAQKLNVPPVALLAQSALETGWGTATPGNNLFGVKATDDQAGTMRPTHEMVDGLLTAQTATFRDYASPAASIADYVQQITSGFQNVTGQSTVGGFAQALQAGGYATDSNYAAKIISISQSPMMARVLQTLAGSDGATAP